MGHVLLRQWSYPLYDNEEAADEFATAIMLMVGQGDRIRAKIEFFDARPSLLEAIAKAFRDDRHPTSRQRARNIERWLGDPELVGRWQQILVPHMQTAMLEQLQQAPAPWVDLPLVAQQLALRRSQAGP